MTLTQLAPPYPIFTDKSGSPLDNGYLYFGTVNLNPETNPITVYYDTAFTQPAAQPLRTSNGYVMRNGSPAAIYTNGYFSVTVRDKNKSMVIYSPSGYGITPGTSASLTDQMTYNEGGTGAVNRVLTSRLQDYVSVKDFGAVGDGTTDDTTAFKNAIAEAAGNFQHIFVPSGFYVISDTLNLNPNNASPIGGSTGLFGTRVVGDETMATRILFKPASSTTPLFLIVGTSGNNTDQGVENIYIQPFDSSYNRMGIGIELRGACFANITNVYAIQLKDGFNINNTGGAGVFSEFNLLRNCRTVYCTRGFVLDSSNGDTSFHGTNFDRCICNIGQTSGDKGLALIGTSGKNVNLYNSHVNIAFFGNNSATAYMIYGEYVSYQLNTCSITCENNAAIYINNGNMGFKGRVDNTGTITFSGNGIFVCDSYLFPKNATTNVLYSGHILEPVTNNFDQYIKSTATTAIFATRNGANQGLVASVPLGGSFVVGSNTTQDAANFAPMISLSIGQVVAHAGGMILSAYDSTNALNQVVNINAQENANNGSVYPVTDNKPTLGFAARRWKEVFAVAGTINTSDEREKQDIANLDEVELRVAVRLKGLIKKFRWKEAVAEKGNNARIHVGVIAQDVKSAFEAEGLDGFRYGILCYDEWDAKYEPEYEEVKVNYPEIGEVTECVETGTMKLVRAAGNAYGIRYDELLSFIIAAI